MLRFELRNSEAARVTQMLPVYTRVTLHSLVSRPELNGHEGFVATPVGENGRYGVLLDGKVVPLNLQPACLRGITRVEPLPAYLGCEWTPGPPDAGLTVQSRILGNNETTESVGLSAETRYYPVPVSIVLMMNSHPDEYDVMLKLPMARDSPTPQIYAVQGLRVLQRHNGITGTVQGWDAQSRCLDVLFDWYPSVSRIQPRFLLRLNAQQAAIQAFAMTPTPPAPH